MAKDFLTDILACPRCKTALKITSPKSRCPKCRFPYQKKGGIWHFLDLEQKGKHSHNIYELMHTDVFARPNDGSYEILAAIARGNKTVDIACGDGYLELLNPQTVGVEFSLNALKKARAHGAKKLVLADAHSLPFRENSFDIAICAGSLEHFTDVQKAIFEMARVSKIQVITVHRYPKFPLGKQAFDILSWFFSIRHQPIERPLTEKQIQKMCKEAGLRIVFKGVWTFPLNWGRPIKFLPEFKNIPSCLFTISIKS